MPNHNKHSQPPDTEKHFEEEPGHKHPDTSHEAREKDRGSFGPGRTFEHETDTPHEETPAVDETEVRTEEVPFLLFEQEESSSKTAGRGPKALPQAEEPSTPEHSEGKFD